MTKQRSSLIFRIALITVLLASLLSSAAFAPRVQAAVGTVIVNTTNDSNNVDGCADNGTGTCSLRDAIAYANTNSTSTTPVAITVPAGTYTLSDSSNTNYQISGTANVVINGAGASSTIIDGASVNNPNGSGNFVRVFDIAEGAIAAMSGLTIRNGGNSSTGSGGGILNEGTLTLDAVVVTQNGAPGFNEQFADFGGCGGGIANFGTLTITESSIVGNAAPMGGGICNGDPGMLTIEKSTVSGNVAYFGGGIANMSTVGNPFVDVRAADVDVAVAMRDSVVTGNTASTEIFFLLITQGNVSGGIGGGILTTSGVTTIENSTISDNTAAGVAINNANVSSGRVASLGGGIYNAALDFSSPSPSPSPGAVRDGGAGTGLVDLLNSTISGNTATAGGALYQHSTEQASLTAVTVANNTTGIASNTADSSEPVMLTQSIVADSRAGDNCTTTASGGIVGVGSNLDSGSTCGFTLSNVDPMLDPLANNGGITPTHPLQPGSPAIDAAGTVCAPTDQRGMPRPQPAGGACDIGAYEFVPPAPQIGVNPTALDFGGQEVGTTSAAKQIAVANYGDAPLSISSVAISGPNADDFTVTGNTCGTTVAPGTGCVISVTFKPSVQAAESATLTITDNTGNVAGSTQTVTLAGTGTVAVSYNVVVSVAGSGSVTPTPGSYSYQAGMVINHTATPAAGSVFIGWVVDGQFVGFGNPLALPVTSNRTVVATFAARPSFTDVPTTQPNYEAITQLAARGIIRGNGDGTYAPNAQVLRAQSAGLIARTFGWDEENHGNPFPDQCDENGQNCIDNDLWNSVGSLAFYSVARGYPDKTYQPRNPVLNAQVISFITRGFVAKGYWVAATTEDKSIYSNVPQESGHRLDLITYNRYAGALPGLPASGPFTNYDQPALRGFYAQALWQGYSAYFSVNRIP